MARRMTVIVVRCDPSGSSGEIAAVRLVGLLPPHWRCAPDAGPDLVRLDISLAGTGGPEAVRARVQEVAEDRALYGWRVAETGER